MLMGKKKRTWQDSRYVLSYFGKSLREARKRYLQYIEAGIEQGRRQEFVDGGLIRSLGGWQAVKDAILGRPRVFNYQAFRPRSPHSY